MWSAALCQSIHHGQNPLSENAPCLATVTAKGTTKPNEAAQPRSALNPISWQTPRAWRDREESIAAGTAADVV
ncbi:hypothetical protein BP5796_03918 [Coleophoma crateriformis]|uniref:Uncharacterized protein n=1 Tax=Coleophoma crateriformis TaxID=565419 RepID=A0A3D8SH20_9HELO|nr:hypothetical protein BP5796_03918 [Coleophoma crateriformis]